MTTGPADEAIGDLRVGTVVVNVHDMERATRFWRDALGYLPRDAEPDPEFRVLADPAGAGTSISLQLTTTRPPGAGPVHLDLYTAEQQRQVDRLVAAGATLVADWSYPPDPDFIVLRDPDGNEFCVIDQPGG